METKQIFLESPTVLDFIKLNSLNESCKLLKTMDYRIYLILSYLLLGPCLTKSFNRMIEQFPYLASSWTFLAFLNPNSTNIH